MHSRESYPENWRGSPSRQILRPSPSSGHRDSKTNYSIQNDGKKKWMFGMAAIGKPAIGMTIPLICLVLAVLLALSSFKVSCFQELLFPFPTNFEGAHNIKIYIYTYLWDTQILPSTCCPKLGLNIWQICYKPCPYPNTIMASIARRLEALSKSTAKR